MRVKLFSIIFFYFFGMINISLANINNNIIAKIENEIITSFEIKNKILISLILANQEINQKNIDSIKEKVFDLLIQQKLKKIELSKYDFEIDQSKINQYLRSITSNDIEGLKRKLKERNLSYELFLKEIEIQFKWQSLIYKIYSSKINIDEKTVNSEVEDFIKNGSNIEELDISEIEILINNNNSDLEKIKKIQQQINEVGFEEAAFKFSTSSTSKNKGKLGWIPSKSLSNEIYAILKKMKIGEVSKPIQKPNSVLFLKLNNKKNSENKNLDVKKIKMNIINAKKNEIFNLYSNSHLSKLKNTSIIEYYK